MSTEENKIVVLFRLTGGQIVESRESIDSLGVLRQLAAIPACEQAEA